MTFDFPTALIAVIFASQILVCSFVSAWRFAAANRLVRTRFPQREYPKLYPVAPEIMQRQHNLRMAVRLTVGVAAALLLTISLARGTGAAQLAGYMICVALAQLLPVLVFLPQQINLMRAIRAMPAPAVRSADLRQWQATDFVPRSWIILGVIMTTLSLANSAWLWLRDPQHNLQMHALSAAISALLLGRMLYVISRPVILTRPDPYMSAEDLFRSRQLRLRMLFRMAVLLGAYFIFMEMHAAKQMQFEFFYVAAGVSILIQLMSLRATQMVRNAIMQRDLAPYRAEPVNTEK